MRRPRRQPSRMNHASLDRSRRAFLRGMGVAVTLPWLESLSGFTQTMPTAAASSNSPPLRLATLFMPNGVNTEHWQAQQRAVGDLGLSQTLQPLAPHQDKLFIPRGLTHRNAHRGDGHYAKTANFLSGEVVFQTRGDDLAVGLSMDQAIAQAFGDQTPLSSLVLATERTRRQVDNNVGFTQIYGGHISWSDANTPVAKEIFPRAVFDMLFGVQPSADGQPRPRYGEDASVLDAVADDARYIRPRVSAEDRRQLEAYYEAIRDIERRIEQGEREQALEAWRPDPLDPRDFDRPEEGRPSDPSVHMRLMLDMIVLAFRMNATRVASFMFGNAVSGRNMGFLEGVTGGHHNISHHENNPDNKRMYQLINQWHVEHLAYFLAEMDAVREGDGTLLDHTMVLFGSGLSDGNRHSPRDLPIVVAGGGFNGRAGDYSGQPLCGLHLLLMQRMGLRLNAFGDATAPLG